MIPAAPMSLPVINVIPPSPLPQNTLTLGQNIFGFIFNKTAWIVQKQADGYKVLFEHRGSSQQTAIAYNARYLAIGDAKGILMIFADVLVSGQALKPYVEVQVLMTDVSCLAFLDESILAIGGGRANAVCRQYFTSIAIRGRDDVKVVCDGTGGPSKAVNDLKCAGKWIVMGADDRSVTVFTCQGDKLFFQKSFNDYGGLVSKVAVSADGLVGYGGSKNKFLVRSLIKEDQPETVHFASAGNVEFEDGQLVESKSAKVNGPSGIVKKVIGKGQEISAFDHVGNQVYQFSIGNYIIGSESAINGDYQVSIDGRRIRLSEKGQEVRNGWSAHDSTVTNLVWIDEKQFASVGLDGHLFVWSIDVLLKPVSGNPHAHHGPISSLVYNPVTKQLVTFGQEDASIRFFQSL